MNPATRLRNPYIVGRPIAEPELFFGRESLFEFIHDQLENHQQVILLHGQRRIGKSSVLAQIPNFVGKGEFVFVLFDLQDKAKLPLERVLQNLATKILDRLMDVTELPRDAAGEMLSQIATNNNIFADDFLPRISELLAGKPLVLLLDEFDVLNNYQPDAAVEHFFPHLQELLERYQDLFVIPVIGRQPEDLDKLLHLFRRAPNQRIGLLDRTSATRLIVEPVKGILTYEPDAIQAILALTSGHPYFTQVMCAAVFNRARAEEREVVTAEDVRDAVDDAIELGEGGLAWFRDGLHISDRVFFYAVAESQVQDSDPVTLLESHGVAMTESLRMAGDRLVSGGYIQEVDRTEIPRYRVEVELVRRWLVQRYPLRRGIEELEEVDLEAKRLYEEATQARQHGTPDRAIPLYESVLSANPNHFSAMFDLAEAYLEEYQIDRAVELFDRAYLVNPLKAKEHRDRALQLQQYQLRFAELLTQGSYSPAIAAHKSMSLRQELGLDLADAARIEHQVTQQIESQRESLRSLYREAVERFASRGSKISPVGRRVLEKQREELGLSPEEAKAIEREILKTDRDYQLREYEQAFREAIQYEYPLSGELREDLLELQRVLGLAAEDVAEIESRIETKQAAIAGREILDNIHEGLPKIQIVTFDIVNVDSQGKIVRREMGNAKSFFEDLGNGVSLHMMSIPGGEFLMGAPRAEAGSQEQDSERPQHRVQIDPFWMGKFPVTQAQYQAIVGKNPSHFKGENRPVESISWNDAVAFCEKLSQRTGREYRLPSEAEWEYACRAGTTTPFHFGETISPEIANYNANHSYGKAPKGIYRQETTVVGSFQVANAFGMYDMHGNVWERCADTWKANYQGAPIDGSAWIEPNRTSHSLRGGSWNYYPGFCRSAYRVNDYAGYCSYDIGFRVVCSARELL
ncbi:SUMF1/EgtB/PvdO family nonheme iron enzyme [Pseudanabaena sp. PCC 6802]|uniref:SUMF1/EgtB/PvdO family nonheme iron enzyme n=1 Tax=Pseudanabaena sp. PCC 6802 TaxID=118173 RepID=UPI00034DF072|nr:SUMF1/EgtB/PvdO family nonheme iron enzyme [Pseudanabaena sp. PCC 6802]